jgi:hypothetical protein
VEDPDQVASEEKQLREGLARWKETREKGNVVKGSSIDKTLADIIEYELRKYR